MLVLRSLRLAGYGLLALVLIALFALPAGVVPMGLVVVFGALAALDLCAVLVLTLWRDHSLRGWVQALVAFSLVLLLVGGLLSQLFTNGVIVESSIAETTPLYGRGIDGYSLTLEGIEGEGLDEARYAVVLTRPDAVSLHETISTSAPLSHEGIEVHPLALSPLGATFLVQYNSFRPLLWVGGVLFVMGLGLSAIPAVRRKEEG